MVAMKRRKTSVEDPSSLIASKMDKRRYDCMMNQRRYRERKKCKTQHTEWYVDDLHREIQRLEDHAAALKSNALMKHLQASTQRCQSISKYTNLFQFGLSRVPGQLLNEQLEIMSSLMHEHVSLNGVIGVYGLKQQWEALNEYFPKLTMKVVDMQTFGNDHSTVIVDATFDLLFNQHTLSCLFPQTNKDLQHKLIDQIIQCPLRLTFIFGESQVESMEMDLNFFDGIFNFLGNLLDTLLVLRGPNNENSRLTHQGLISLEAILSTSFNTPDQVRNPIKVDMIKPTLMRIKSDVSYILM
ncbi:hypothetical protein THRCLA_00774 [Thraustotheca clavata]|uniref:BZIP domain-containing protein n=1 Tax=Thraustotheca clavata TaxID=74557 RepID=A0A1W0AAM0_9STRA|nr:hypothetical protein THRCLA_00774 [Thraustotheca clavata]